MLSAVITWGWGGWVYDVREEQVHLENGLVSGAFREDTSDVVVYQLRHRWPALQESRCLVLRSPLSNVGTTVLRTGGGAARDAGDGTSGVSAAG
jgi:hypothetical protein